VLRILGGVVIGSIVGVSMYVWLASEDVPPAVVGAPRESQELVGRLAELEDSDSIRASEYAALMRRVAELEEQVRRLSTELEDVDALRSEVLDLAARAERAAQPRVVVGLPPTAPSTAPADLSVSPDGEPRAAPRNLTGVEAVPGQSFVLRVTGSAEGPVWGTDVYTDDSSIAAAAVHAGLLQPGETGTIMVTVQQGYRGYAASSRNGIESMDYGEWGRSYMLQRLY